MNLNNLDIIPLLDDFNVDYRQEGHKHTHSGWINMECPFCFSTSGHEGYHLGWNLGGRYFNCWRCGGHSTIPTLAHLLALSPSEVKKLLPSYQGGYFIKKEEPSIILRRKEHLLPSNTGKMKDVHKKYLEGRGFDPGRLERDWQLLGTGIVSHLTTGPKNISLDFKNRILIPINWNGKRVSFQARDFTDKQFPKYKTCPKDRELIFHKDILFGRQDMWGETGICVEGVTDVFRLGFSAVATFGIEFTNHQIRVLAKNFKRIPVIFDGNEPQAKKKADELVKELKKGRDVDSFRVDISGDPGAMSQKEADYLVKQLIK